MAMSGFICHDDYYDRLKRLSNEEVGNLFRMLMLYHAGRQEEMEALGFIENEGIAFDFIASDIERMEEKQNAASEANRVNGSKGGRPKKRTEPEETEQNPTKAKETETNRTKPEESEQNPTKPYKDKDKEKDKEKESLLSSEDAHEILAEQNRVMDAAEDAGFIKSNSVRARLLALYAQYGLEKMLKGFESCVNHSAPNLAYLEACLKDTPRKEKPRVIAQDFPQRSYEDYEENAMNALAAEIAEFEKGTG